MTKQTRRKFTASFKAKVAPEAVKNQETLAELPKRFDISPVMISQWKAAFLENMSAAFEKGKSKEEPDVNTQELYAQIGQQKVEIEFLKKSFKRLGG